MVSCLFRDYFNQGATIPSLVMLYLITTEHLCLLERNQDIFLSRNIWRFVHDRNKYSSRSVFCVVVVAIYCTIESYQMMQLRYFFNFFGNSWISYTIKSILQNLCNLPQLYSQLYHIFIFWSIIFVYFFLIVDLVFPLLFCLPFCLISVDCFIVESYEGSFFFS